jgi:protein-tyrosine phosphatase
MKENRERISVLFVCMGNICRSPTAEGVFRHQVAEAGLDEFVEIDSAGTHAYHVGEPPDRRAQAAAEASATS